ncbi:MAG TPA: sulfatase-like hydrolase/transferase, partial [Pilimelia sp.]|nr:sulfatase-like hydrolase/transferase [Pilimelia sp.]
MAEPRPPETPEPAADQPEQAADQPEPAADQPEPAAPSRVRREAYAFLEIAAVCGLAVAQPLLDITGKSPDFFLFYGAGAVDVLLMVAVFVLLPPLVLWGAGALAGLAGHVVRRVVHAATLGALLALLAVQVGKQTLPVRGLPLGLLAAAAGAALVAAYVKWEASRQLLRYAAVGPVVFALLFVFGSPASGVVLTRYRPGAAAAAVGPHPPVVLIVFDELPTLSLLDSSSKIDAARFPNFARLAGRSTWYRNATGVSGWTPQALPAMLTGRYPAKDAAPHYSQYPDNLFTLLGSRYDLRVQESITQLCPPRLCERAVAQRGGLPVMLEESAALLQDIVSPQERHRDPTAGFQEPTVADQPQAGVTPPTDPKFRWNTLDDNQPVRFRDFVTGLSETAPAAATGSSRPTAHVLHLLLPHTPWRYLPSGVQYEAPEDLPTDGEWWPILARQRHLLQLGYADRLLGATLDALEDSGLFDRSLVVVTADHGVSFTPGSVGRSLTAVRRSAAEVLWVPLFIKRPGQGDGVVDDRNWEHVDLVPTVADIAGMRVPWHVDGLSALRQRRATADKRYHDTPGAPTTVDGAANLALVRSGFVPPLPAPPMPHLIGLPTSRFAVTDGGPRASVTNREDFRSASPHAGSIPALVYG